ncbi:hypothetical protein BH11GEM1_BH11GEM1_31030 [soil metagenome]
MTPSRALVACPSLAGLGGACRSKPATDVVTGADSAKVSRNHDHITRDELAEASLLGTTAWLAIQRVRPSYLIDKTAGAARTIHPLSVSVNGGELTSLNMLITIPTQAIAEIRYLDIGNAAQRFHNRATGPVILVTLTVRPSP